MIFLPEESMSTKYGFMVVSLRGFYIWIQQRHTLHLTRKGDHLVKIGKDLVSVTRRSRSDAVHLLTS